MFMFFDAHSIALARVSRDGSVARIAPTAPAVQTAFQLWFAFVHHCPLITSLGAFPSIIAKTGPVRRFETCSRINSEISGASRSASNHLVSAI